MIGHKLQKNCSIRFENSFNQFSNFDASKGTLLAIARWCHKYQLTFMHKTLILDRCVLSDSFRLAFRFYTVKSPKISVVLSNILVWLLNNPKLRLFPLLMIKKHSIFWFWSDSEMEVFSTRFSLWGGHRGSICYKCSNFPKVPWCEWWWKWQTSISPRLGYLVLKVLNKSLEM